MNDENEIDKARREQAARRAKLTGYIEIVELMEIMAEDEAYNSILPRLREEYLPQGFIGPRQGFIGPRRIGDDDEKLVEPSNLLETPDGRFYYWMNLIRRWARLGQSFPLSVCLNCYKYDVKQRNFEIIDHKEATPDHIRDFISLDEFKKYLEDVDEIYQLQIPLPELLFPEPDEIYESKPSENSAKNLEIYFENDNEIKIKTPKKKAQIVTCDILGFRDNTTLEWRTLLQILENPDNTYEVGRSNIYSGDIKVRNPEYDRKVKCLKRISDKLINYLRKSHSLKIPDNYKLFEPAKNLGKGIFKPVFKVGSTHRFDNVTSLEFKYDQYPKEHLIKEFEKLTGELSKGTSDESAFDKLITVGKILYEKVWMEKDKLEKLINPRVDEEFIRKETSKENFKPDE